MMGSARPQQHGSRVQVDSFLRAESAAAGSGAWKETLIRCERLFASACVCAMRGCTGHADASVHAYCLSLGLCP
jgi:hypothetical protein